MSSPSLNSRRASVPPELSRFLAALFGPTSGALIDIRVRRREGAMDQHFVVVRDRRAARMIAEFGAVADVYLGVLPRHRRLGGKEGLMRHGSTLWADCDSANAAAALDQLAAPPSLVVASGSEGHRHAYWLLRRPLTLADIECANRRLATVLGADTGAVTNAATILRPPGTHNFKNGTARPVRLLEVASMRRYRAAQVVGDFADPKPARPTSPSWRAVRAPGADPLLTIAPAEYFRVLTGREPNRAGKLRCPLHPDETPSLHVYSTPERGWHCYGCNTGGSIYDLAAALWLSGQSAGAGGRALRGADFVEVRERLMGVFFGERM